MGKLRELDGKRKGKDMMIYQEGDRDSNSDGKFKGVEIRKGREREREKQ